MTIIGVLREPKPCLLEAALKINNDDYIGAISEAITFKEYIDYSLLPENGSIAKKNKNLCTESDDLYIKDKTNEITRIYKTLQLPVKPINSVSHPRKCKFILIPECDEIVGYDFVFGPDILDKFGYFPEDVLYDDGSDIIAYRTPIYQSSSICNLINITIHRWPYTNLNKFDWKMFRLIEPYRNVFGPLDEEGMRVEPMEINTSTDFPLVGPYPTKMNLNMQELFRLEMSKPEFNIIYEKSYSNHDGPIKFKPKKDGTYRLVRDSAKINHVTEKFECKPPNISSIVEKIEGYIVFSTLDLTKGTNQVKLRESDKVKTAFTSPFGRFQFKRCAFGLKNSSQYLQSKMDEIFGDRLWTGCVIYCDDILVFGKTQEEHDNNLTWVLDRCRTYNIKLNVRKLEVGKSEVEYCGVMMCCKPKPIKAKLESWRRYEVPEDAGALKNLLSKFSHLHMFLNDPESKKCLNLLHTLNKKKFRYTISDWKDEHHRAYCALVITLLRAANAS